LTLFGWRGKKILFNSKDGECTEIKLKDLFKTWWPIAISWVLLALEPMFFSSIISRYPNAKVNLAAYGNVAWMIPIVIQSPIMLIQAASASLCKDKETFYKLRKFANWMGVGLTTLHVLIAVTPLYFFVVRTILNVPEEVVVVARQGLIFMIPWAGSISYRRFHQGILVRFGHTRRMSFGTILRLISDVACVALLSLIPGINGLAVATAAQGFSVFLEGAYVGIVTQPVIKKELKSNNGEEIISWKSFAKYYTPFMLNSIIFILYNPMNSAAMGRLPFALASLATWPVVNGFAHMINNLGQACREVTLTYIRHEGAFPIIRRFCLIVGVISLVILSLFCFTPLFNWYLTVVVSLPSDLIQYAKITLMLLIPVGLTFSLSNMFTGLIAFSGKTISLLTSTIVMLLVVFIGLMAAIILQPFEGIYAVAGVYLIASIVQLGWLYWTNKDSVANLEYDHA
jgi:hypothetical protein